MYWFMNHGEKQIFETLEKARKAALVKAGLVIIHNEQNAITEFIEV